MLTKVMGLELGPHKVQQVISKVIGNNVLNIIVLTFICDNLENSDFGFMYLLFQNMVVKVLNKTIILKA